MPLGFLLLLLLLYSSSFPSSIDFAGLMGEGGIPMPRLNWPDRPIAPAAHGPLSVANAGVDDAGDDAVDDAVNEEAGEEEAEEELSV